MSGRRTARRLILSVLAAGSAALVIVPSASAGSTAAGPSATAATPSLSTSDRLTQRRFVVAGTRAYELGTEDARYPVMGFHTRGEMGGFWSPPVKLLDGLWFGVNGSWVGSATQFTRAYGTVGFSLPTTSGVALQRTDVAPDGSRSVLVGLRLSSPTSRTVTLNLAAHSELMSVYPWGETTPSQSTVNGQDAVDTSGGKLSFTDAAHPYGAVVGSADLTPSKVQTGAGFRGPQEPAQVCAASGPDSGPAADTCDDTAYGKGVGGQLDYSVQLTAKVTRTLWFVVAGSDTSLTDAQRTFASTASHPDALLAEKVAARNRLASVSRVSLPGDPLLERSLVWSRQDLADLHQHAEGLQVRATNAGKNYPAPVGTIPAIDFEGAGFPDYPWLFGTDGEYTAYALLVTGQAQVAENHLRALRDVSDLVNNNSGKIVHEVVTDGSVFFGANADPGNTDESVKFPSTVALVWRWTGDNAFRDSMYPAAKRAVDYVTSQLDADADGWPEGAGNVEREKQGTEKVDNAVYLIRGLYDVAAMAASRGESSVAAQYRSRAAALLERFDNEWWVGTSGQHGVPAYADSLQDPGNQQVFQRYWTGLTPLEAELPNGAPRPGVAPADHALATLALHETSCYTGAYGLFHTGSGPGTVTNRAGCDGDRAVSDVPDERDSFTLNSAIAAVAEGNYGRIDAGLSYSDKVARLQFPSASSDQAEMPGAMPELAGGDLSNPSYYTSNVARRLTERGSVMQAWGAYGTWWPVVHQEFGVAPNLGAGRLAVVPQLPANERRITLSRLQMGSGSIDEAAAHSGTGWATRVSSTGLTGVRLSLGTVLPRTARVAAVRLDGGAARYTATLTDRGLEVVVSTTATGSHLLLVQAR